MRAGQGDDEAGGSHAAIPRQAIVDAYTLIAASYCAASAVLFAFLVPHPFLAAVHASAFAAVVANRIVLARTGDFDLATHAILATGTTVVVSLFATGGWAGTGFLWPFAYLPYAFFLASDRQVVGWVTVLGAALVAVTVAGVSGLFTFPYDGVQIGNFFAALAIFVACMFLFLRARVRREVLLAREMELARLNEIVAFKTQFLNTAAHELSTPLTPVRLQLHVLKRGSRGEWTDAQRKSVDIVERNVDRLARLVGETLDAARFQSGRLGIVQGPVDLAALVREAGELFAEAAAQDGVAIDVDAAGPLPVVCDAGRINQVLVNLVSNALKFTPRGGSVSLRARREGEAVVVSVADTGIGLEAAQIERLFAPFSQVHDPMTNTRVGSGLGLYISRGIVELHGGRIGIASPGPGKGTTVTFTLPAAGAP